MKHCMLIDNETGEVIDENFRIDELEDQERKRKMAEKDRLSREFKEKQSEYLGNFIFYIFKNIENFKDILTDADLVKFIFCGTYIKHNGALMLDNNTTYIDKKRLNELLQVSNTIFNRFYKKLIKNKLILEENNKIYINLNIFWRGKKTEYKKITKIKLKDFTRIYIKTARELYLNYKNKNHKKLAMIYKLIPFLNWKYNILCSNPNEENKNNIDALTIEDIMDELNYSKSNITRFKHDFYSLKYNDYQIFKTLQSDENYKNSIILVNPLVIYGGNDINNLQYLINLFNIKPLH